MKILPSILIATILIFIAFIIISYVLQPETPNAVDRGINIRNSSIPTNVDFNYLPHCKEYDKTIISLVTNGKSCNQDTDCVDTTFTTRGQCLGTVNKTTYSKIKSIRESSDINDCLFSICDSLLPTTASCIEQQCVSFRIPLKEELEGVQ
ncbi:MAG: hypothetical protein ACI9IA_002084 [Enterobacterales bacterium]|jgi:hypothetical protein